MTMVRVVVAVAASPERVWKALTVPSEVSAWDGVNPLDVPDLYPVPGQHARWTTRVGPFRLTLHDRVRSVLEGRELSSTIDVGFVHLEEQYLLGPTEAGTELVSESHVSSRVPGLGWLAARLTQSSVRASMERLRVRCEETP